MARLNLYIDTTDNNLIAGLNAPTSVPPNSIPFFFGDTLNLQIYLLNSNGTTLAGSNPFTIINTAGIQLFLYLDDGTVGGTIYTQQITWATDPTNSFFYSTLSLNTAALQTLLGENTSASCWLKIGYVQNGLQTTVISAQVTIGVGIPSTALVVPPGLTPLSAEVANQLFVHVDGNPAQPGSGFYIISPAGKKILIHAIDNPDGTCSFMADPVN